MNGAASGAVCERTRHDLDAHDMSGIYTMLDSGRKGAKTQQHCMCMCVRVRRDVSRIGWAVPLTIFISSSAENEPMVMHRLASIHSGGKSVGPTLAHPMAGVNVRIHVVHQCGVVAWCGVHSLSHVLGILAFVLHREKRLRVDSAEHGVPYLSVDHSMTHEPHKVQLQRCRHGRSEPALCKRVLTLK